MVKQLYVVKYVVHGSKNQSDSTVGIRFEISLQSKFKLNYQLVCCSSIPDRVVLKQLLKSSFFSVVFAISQMSCSHVMFYSFCNPPHGWLTQVCELGMI